MPTTTSNSELDTPIGALCENTRWAWASCAGLHVSQMAEQQLHHINSQIESLLYSLGQEGLLDDQFAQLMQLQVRS